MVNNSSKVLDHGEVVYVNHMGDDLTVANAARVSFSKESKWDIDEVAKQRLIASNSPYNSSDLHVLSAKDTKLIGYLAKHNHWTPFALKIGIISLLSLGTSAVVGSISFNQVSKSST